MGSLFADADVVLCNHAVVWAKDKFGLIFTGDLGSQGDSHLAVLRMD